MAIVKMRKFTLLTFESYKKDLLKELQKFEDVHFRNLQNEDLTELDFLMKDTAAEGISHAENELNKIKFAMTKLEPYVEKQKGLSALTAEPRSINFGEFDVYPDKYNYNLVYDSIKFEDEKINTMKSDIARLKSENESLRAWLKLDVSPDELDRFKTVKSLIGTISKVAADNFKNNIEETYNTAHVEFLGNIKDDAVVLIIIPADIYDDAFAYFKTLGFSKTTLGFKGVPAEVIKVNNDEIALMQALQNESLNRIKKLDAEYSKLEIVSDYYETALERERACQNFVKLKTVFVVEGWTPDEDTDEFKKIVAKICGKDYYLEDEEVAKDNEEVPIKLKNNGFVSAFEDITAMFSMPKYNEMDPTAVLTPFYMMFFGLMLGDAGSGLVMLIASAIALKFFSLKEGARRFIKFFFFLSFATIAAGLVYGSFFGYTVIKPLRAADGTSKAILDSQADVLTMMIASVALGVIQILVGIGAKGYMLIRDGKLLDAVFDSLLWMLTVLSGIGLLVGVMGVIPAGVFTASQYTFVGSLIGLALTQGRSSPTIGGKFGNGLYAVYGLTSYVGDLVSYTRIAALALSGAYISFSFNLMAGLIPAGFTRIVFGGLVFLLGQALNLGLSALGAYVHSCRLQYVEFFGKFYEGGGVPFDAFKLKNKYINIKK